MIFNSTLEILNLKYLLWIIWKMIWSLRRDRLCFAMPSLISNTKLIHHLNHPIQQNEVCTNFMLIMHVELWLYITLSSPSLLEKLINQYLITCTKFALVFICKKIGETMLIIRVIEHYFWINPFNPLLLSLFTKLNSLYRNSTTKLTVTTQSTLLVFCEKSFNFDQTYLNTGLKTQNEEK